VRALKQALPEHALLLTCMTAAGRETLKQLYGETIQCAWLPYDYPGAVQRFLEHFRPQAGIIMETEMWPNLLAACVANGVPMLLANARMSERSFRGYLRWASVTGAGIRSLAGVCAQSEEDAERLRRLGARNVEVAGNLKFDVHPDAAQVASGRAWRAALGRPVVLLASTREGEEQPLLKSFSRAVDSRVNQPENPLIVLVPRHPQRFDEVAQWADARRSRAASPAADARVYLGDSMGEMPFYYGAADVAVIGGSFGASGGQNLIEALAVGVPVIAGPSMFNFAEATRLAIAAGAALQVADTDAAARRASELLADETARAAMGAAGKKLCDANRGATERHLAVCLSLLEPGTHHVF
jgi:3-deoxy-D-manno-octulosonic-acid transferase